jgi:hypothetical protein
VRETSNQVGDGAATDAGRPSGAARGAGRIALEVAGVAALILLTRVPALLLFDRSVLFNTDELELTFAALDRFLGVPSNVLIWPAGTMQMLAVPLFGIDFVVSSGLRPSPTAYAAYFSHTYRAPWHALALIRWSVALLSSVGFAALYVPFTRLLRSRTTGLLAALFLATTPVVWLHSHVAMLDAITFGFACASMAVLLRSEVRERDIVVAGLLAGLAVASKVTVIPLMPFVAGILVQRRPGGLWRAVLLFGGAAALGFMVGCPYIWTDPVRLAKTVYGNATRAGTPLGLARTLRMAADVVPVWLWGLLVLAAIWCLRQRQFWILGGTLATVLGTIYLVSRSGIVFPRYLLPIVPVAAVLGTLALGREQGAGWERAIAQRLRIAPVAAFLALVVVANMVVYARSLPREMGTMVAAVDVARVVGGLPDGTRVAIPWDVFRHVAASASSESLGRLGRGCGEAFVDGTAVADFTSRRGVPRSAVAAVPRVFDEEEQAFLAAMAVMSSDPTIQGIDLRVWAKPELAPRFGFLTQREALAMFEAGELDAVVVNDVPSGYAPERSFGPRLHLLRR